jgi:hypothetical protein
MSAEALVDAALAGLDQGEFVTIPALPNAADSASFFRRRSKPPARRCSPNLSHATPAERYQVKAQ